MKKKPVFFAFQAEKKNPLAVNRSSAVFYFKSDENVKTSIHFLNYWKIKRGVNDIRVAVSARAMDGELLFSQEVEVPEQGSVELQLESLLRENSVDNSITQGSVEIEIFSEENLFIPFPAIVVRYCGPDWHTCAHSSQRFFSPLSADKDFDKIHYAEEGNQTIHNNPDFEPFFIIHNGSKGLVDEDAYIEISSDSGRTVREKLPDINWEPYETKVFYLKDLIDYRTHLASENGTFRIGYNAFGVFPRLIAGFHNVQTDSWSLDHTNFAASLGAETDDLFEVNNQKGFKNLVLKIPGANSQNWTCFADVYPTYPRGEYALDVATQSSDAMETKRVDLPDITESRMTRVELDHASGAELSFCSESKLPRRFHIGIHYSYRNSDPAFIVGGPHPHEFAPSFTKWAPIFAGQDNENYLFVSNSALGNEESMDVTYNCLIYNSFSDDPMEFEFVILGNEYKIIHLEKEIENLRDYLQGASGWIYMKNETPSRSLIYYQSVFKDRSVACDHSF